MGKLIDADLLMEAYLHDKKSGAVSMVKLIEEAPTAEKHGHWIFGHTLGHSWMKCSECLVSQDGQTACFSYCPNCGAKMDEKGE